MAAAVISTAMLAGMIGGWELSLILVIAIVLFWMKGPTDFSRGLREGVRAYKRAVQDYLE